MLKYLNILLGMPQQLQEKLFSLVQSKIGRALIRTFTARTLVALGGLALLLVVGRIHGPAGVGIVALAQSFLLGAGLLSQYGMGSTLMLYAGRGQSVHNLMSHLRWAASRALTASFVLCAMLLATRFLLESLFSAPGLSTVLTGIAVAIPPFTLSFMLAGLFKGIHMPATACLLENGLIALIAGFFIWLHALLRTPQLDIIGYAFASASIFTAAIGLCRLWFWYHSNIRTPAGTQTALSNYDHSKFRQTSGAFFIFNMSTFMQHVIGIILAGWLLSADDLGLFKSSQQVARAIGFIMVVIHAIYPPRFSALYCNANQEGLGRAIRQSSLLGFAISLPALSACLIFPTWVLGFFGQGFSEGATLLRIIAFAQLIEVSTGSVGSLLNMTGHEKLMRNIALTCNSLGLAALIGFMILWGANGAAIAVLFIVCSQNISALAFAWIKLGIWAIPTPNFLQQFGIDSEKEKL